MHRQRKRNYGYVILFLGLWFFWFQNVSASQMLFPFVADDWLSFEGHSFLELQQENGRKNINQTKEKKKDKSFIQTTSCLLFSSALFCNDCLLLYLYPPNYIKLSIRYVAFCISFHQNINSFSFY